MTQPVKKVKSRSTNQMLAIIPINDDVILWTFLDFPQIVTDSESQVQTQKNLLNDESLAMAWSSKF